MHQILFVLAAIGNLLFLNGMGDIPLMPNGGALSMDMEDGDTHQ